MEIDSIFNQDKTTLLYMGTFYFYRWQFSTEGYDVGFGIYRRTKDTRQKAGDMEEILPSQRVNSHLVLEDGSISCSEVGTCK